jgi:hypothetical protein
MTKKRGDKRKRRNGQASRHRPPQRHRGNFVGAALVALQQCEEIK